MTLGEAHQVFSDWSEFHFARYDWDSGPSSEVTEGDWGWIAANNAAECLSPADGYVAESLLRTATHMMTPMAHPNWMEFENWLNARGET